MSAEPVHRYLATSPGGAGVRRGDHTTRGTLVLLHACPLNARMWEPQEALARHGWHVVMPQFRGFDQAGFEETDASSIDDYAQHVANLIDSIGVAQAVIGGLSMGGYVALALYRRAPHLFRGIVLADTRADADTPDARANRERLMALADTGGVAAIAEDMIPKLLGPTTRSTQPALVARVRALILSNRPDALKSALRAMMTRPDSTPTLAGVRVPALVLAGGEDSITPPSANAAIAAAIPGAVFSEISAAGHLSSLEQPDAFNAALRHFLDRL